MQNTTATETGGIIDGLNTEQRTAVTAGDGPTLVLAGAGTGKTRVLAHRAAYLVRERQVEPRAVIAVTFTNKAAREMRDRIDSLLGAKSGLWVGTFHAFGLWLIRCHAEHAGLSREFTVCGQGDQMALVRRALAECGVPTGRYSVRTVLEMLRAMKRRRMLDGDDGNGRGSPIREIGAVYDFYQSHLARHGQVDFDDLLLMPLKLFREHPDILSKYHDRFEHMLVDEYQDTNRVQFDLAHTLTARHRNLFVVGDEDQSIYGWRGAELRNVTEFKTSFPDGRILRLEQNYRSTQNILDAANHLILNNTQRIGKRLWTKTGSGRQVGFHLADTAEREARWVAGLLGEMERPGGDCAVLFRTNAQSREFETEFVRRGIPYYMVAGTRFYQRREIRDMLAYLRIAVQPDDGLSMTLVLGAMPYGIGAKTIGVARQVAGEHGISLYTGLEKLADGSIETVRMPSRSIEPFLVFVESLRATVRSKGVAEAVESIVDKSGYLAKLRMGKSAEDRERVENIEELIAAVDEFSERNPTATMADFLNDVALLSDVDVWKDGERGVTLMTIHAAKGLEFPVVFVVGLEEGLMPHAAAFDDADLEEERRLCYVAMTRAREQLYLSAALERQVHGSGKDRILSRFVRELPEDNIQWLNSQKPPEALSEALPNRDEHELRTGMRVRHPKFGSGYVMFHVGTGDSAKVKVRFDNGRERQFVVLFARLEVIGRNRKEKRT